MACLSFSVPFEDIALAGGTAKTVAQIKTPTNQRVEINGFSVTFDGTTNGNTPVLWELITQTSAGVFANNPTGAPCETGITETVQTSCHTDASTEPTASTLRRCGRVHPQGGLEKTLILAEKLVIAGNQYLGLKLKAAQSVNVTGTLICTE